MKRFRDGYDGSMGAGLCETCEHAQTVVSDRGSTFLRCGLAAGDPRFPKYPRLPVLQCEGWKKRETDKSPQRQPGR